MATEQWIWIDSDGAQWIISGAAGRVLEEAVNAGPAEHSHFTQIFPLLGGNLRTGGRDPARIITLNLWHVALGGTKNRAQLFSDRDSLIAMFDPTRGVSTLRLVRPDGSKSDIRGYAWSRPEMDMKGGTGSIGQPLTVQFWAPWPYWYDPDAYNAGSNTDGVVTATLTLSGASTVTTSVPYDTAANGFVTGYPHSFAITGQATNVDIWIGTTASVNFNSTAGYTIASGNTVNIYGPPFSQPRALLNDTTRIDGYVDKTDTTWAFSIPLGGGTLSAKGGAAGDDGVVTVTYRQYRRGI